MWIVLLDCSGSMGDPFSGTGEFAGRTRRTEAEIKLEAAKLALLEHVGGLGSPDRIALFEFRSTATLVFQGRSDAPELRGVIEALSAGGSTDVAAALRTAAGYASGLPDRIVRVLVVSDGLSDPASATRAARECAEQGAVIDVVLIDPTEQGEAVARAIALHGSVTAVASASDLARGLDAAGRAEAELARQAEEIVARYHREAQAVAAPDPEAERLAFSASYPGVVEPERWHSLVVLLHLSGLQEAVNALLLQKTGSETSGAISFAATRASTLVPRGTWLRLVPRVEGITFNPLSQEVAWHEDVQESSFRFRADPGAAGRLEGALDVFTGALLIAQLPLLPVVRPAGAAAPPAGTEVRTAQAFKSVFASYAHADGRVVDACAAAYRSLGVYVHVDRDSLLSGQVWSRVLRELIEESDLFQLYWSAASAASPHVRDEWQHALGLARGEGFIRPLYWESDWPPPPPELDHLHFARLDLARLGMADEAPALATERPAPEPAAPRAALPVAVIPVLPGGDEDLHRTVAEDVRHAVRFLEETCGLRYYPVPTLLVDDAPVRRVREETTVDFAADGDEADVRALAAVLQALALEFHVLRLAPGANHPRKELEEAFGRGTLLSGEQWDWVRMGAEWYVGRIVEEILPGGRGESRDEPLHVRVGRQGAALGLPGFAADDPVGTLRAFLDQVAALLDAGQRTYGDFPHTGAYSVAPDDFERFLRLCPDAALHAETGNEAYGGEVLPAGTLAGISRAFRVASRRLLGLVAGAARASSPVGRFFVEEVPTHGIYVSPGARAADDALRLWAAERGIPTELTLPGTARTLLCLDAQERFEGFLRRERPGVPGAARLARAFQRSVLVHEHFHAILETGVDDDGDAAAGMDFPDAWSAALPLNESLAAWMELHAARGDAELTALVEEYVHAGEYPAWPYRGAAALEALFRKEGAGAVRRVVAGLRRDPRAAQMAFDRAVRGEGESGPPEAAPLPVPEPLRDPAARTPTAGALPLLDTPGASG